MKKLSSNKGFTLVELIIVIAILAIIMLIAIPNFSGIQQRMQVRADKSSAAQIGKAIRIWYTEYTSDDAFATAVGKDDPDVAWDSTDKVWDITKPGRLPAQGTAAVSAAPINSIAKLDEYIDADMVPTSLRKDAAGLVEDHQFYYAGLVGSGTAEKVVVCISNTTYIPQIPVSGTEIAVGYTGDYVTAPTFDSTVAYIEP